MIDFIFMSVAEAWNQTTETFIRINKAVGARAQDLKLLSSLYLARFIIWRELRRRHRQKRF
jgi:hypothetical protein